MDTPTKPQTNGKHDVWSHRIAIGGTILVLVIDISIIGCLAARGQEVPATLTALAFTGFTAITAMLHAIMLQPKTSSETHGDQ